MIEGKISLKYYLNKHVKPLNGKYPLYLLIRFQNKQAKIKSRFILFDNDNPYAPHDPFSVGVLNYKDASNYVTEKGMQGYKILMKNESDTIYRVFDFFRILDLNIIENQPSSIIDYSIVPIHKIVNNIFINKLSDLLRDQKLKSSPIIFGRGLDGEPTSFDVAIESLSEVGSKKIQIEIVDKLNSERKAIRLLNKSMRTIDWIANESMKLKYLQLIESETSAIFREELDNMVNNRVLIHYSELSDIFPKMFMETLKTAISKGK